MEKSIRCIILGDPIFKRKSEDLKSRYRDWWNIIVIRTFFTPDINRDSNFCILEFDVGYIETCTNTLIRNGKEVTTNISPEKQVERLVGKLVRNIWKLLKKKYTVLVSVGYSYFTKRSEDTEASKQSRNGNQPNYRRVNISLEKE
jgi:hypothetical protein